MRSRTIWLQYLALAAILIVSSIWCLTAARNLGATFDEPLYLRCGLAFWHNTGGNDLLLHGGTMPLPPDVDALALRIAEHVRGAAWNPEVDLPQMLPIGRTGALVFWWILLIYAWKTGKLIGGAAGGLLAAAMIAIEPIMPGNACLATSDVALTGMVLAASFYFAAGRTSAWTRRVGLPSIFCGLAILSKASGLIFTVLCMVAAEVERLWPAMTAESPEPATFAGWVKAWRQRLVPLWHDLRQIIGIALLITIVYCGSGWHPQWSFLAWAKRLPPDSIFAPPMLWLAGNLRIFNNAISGLWYQFHHNMHGQSAFLLGRVKRSFWYYFPLALTIKLSIPIFIITITLVCLRPRALRNSAIAAAGALLAFSFLMRLQIGVRLVLPLAAFLIVGIAGACANTWRSSPSGWKSGLLAAEVLLAIVWTGSASLHLWPQGICYTNELWGGTPSGYLLLSDSNYDWGQGLPELQRWRQNRGLKRIAVFYFGKDPRIADPGFFSISPLEFSVARLPEIARRQQLRYLAVSITLVYGVYYDGSEIRKLTPVARTQTFLIYDLDRLADKTSDSRSASRG
jgi:hypothetical protein